MNKEIRIKYTYEHGEIDIIIKSGEREKRRGVKRKKVDEEENKDNGCILVV